METKLVLQRKTGIPKESVKPHDIALEIKIKPTSKARKAAKTIAWISQNVTVCEISPIDEKEKEEFYTVDKK